MKTVTVHKSDLLDTLIENKKTHEADFEITWTAFQKKYLENAEALVKAAKNVKKGQQVTLHINLAVPSNHAEDYDRAIQMLDWEVGSEVELTEHEFQQFVQDDWGWKGQVSQLNAFYTGSASPSSVIRIDQ